MYIAQYLILFLFFLLWLMSSQGWSDLFIFLLFFPPQLEVEEQMDMQQTGGHGADNQVRAVINIYFHLVKGDKCIRNKTVVLFCEHLN